MNYVGVCGCVSGCAYVLIIIVISDSGFLAHASGQRSVRKTD